jgi:hypothetical protein
MEEGSLTSIATFSPPIKATHVGDSLPRILIGVGAAGDIPFLVGVDMDGQVELLTLADVRVDWRYNPNTEMWDDVGPNVVSEDRGDPFGEETDG